MGCYTLHYYYYYLFINLVCSGCTNERNDTYGKRVQYSRQALYIICSIRPILYGLLLLHRQSVTTHLMWLAPTYLAGWFTPFVATRMIIFALSAVQTLTSVLVAALGTPTGENTRSSTSRRAVESTRVSYIKEREHMCNARLTLYSGHPQLI